MILQASISLLTVIPESGFFAIFSFSVAASALFVFKVASSCFIDKLLLAGFCVKNLNARKIAAGIIPPANGFPRR